VLENDPDQHIYYD